jgi:hypothetical protein
MAVPLDEVCCASLPLASLPVLAELRCEPGVVVRLDGERAWVCWPPAEERVLRRVLPVAGVELYLVRGGSWYRHGHRVPSFHLPVEGEMVPLYQVLTPAPFQAEPPSAAPLPPHRLRLVRDDRPRTTTALACALADLARWAETATTAQLASIQGTRCGSRVLLLGQRLPALTSGGVDPRVHSTSGGVDPRRPDRRDEPGGSSEEGQRFWGTRLLVPLGLRVEPALPEPVLLDALRVSEQELLVLDPRGGEVIPQDAFRPLKRAGVRRATGGDT